MSEKATYEVGKGKPPRNRRFGQPEGNPNGKTSEQKRAEMKAGELAAQIQLRMLQALSDAVAADDASAIHAIAADPLRLIKDAMDREYGTAVQKVDNTSSDGSMTPVVQYQLPSNGRDDKAS